MWWCCFSCFQQRRFGGVQLGHLSMERLPEPRSPYPPGGPDAPDGARIHVIRLSTPGQPKSWFGRLVLGVVGVVVVLVAVFLSLVAFAIIASVVVVGVGYALWKTRHARKAMRESRRGRG